jgi:hypothetical protein
MPNSDRVRSLLKDLREVRQAKTREGVQKIDSSALIVRMLVVRSPLFWLNRGPASESLRYGDQRDQAILRARHGRHDATAASRFCRRVNRRVLGQCTSYMSHT